MKSISPGRVNASIAIACAARAAGKESGDVRLKKAQRKIERYAAGKKTTRRRAAPSCLSASWSLSCIAAETPSAEMRETDPCIPNSIGLTRVGLASSRHLWPFLG